MKKFLALMLALVMVFALAACGDAGTEPTEAPADDTTAPTEAPADDTTEPEGELATVEEGKLIMATNAAFPPYEMTDDEGNVIGIDADIAAAIAEKLGFELVIDDMDFDGALLAVQQGKADMMLAGLSVTPDREVCRCGRRFPGRLPQPGESPPPR